MVLVPVTRPEKDPKGVQRAIQKLSHKLGPDGSPTFASLTVTGAITAYNGRDVIRYALMMGLVTRRDH